MKRYYQIAIFSVVVAFAGVALLWSGYFARAQTATVPIPNVPLVRQVTADRIGNIRLEGIVTAVTTSPVGTATSTTSTITVNSWGGDWTVNMGPTSTVRRIDLTTTDKGEVQIGDRVIILGKTFSNQTTTVDGTRLQDRSIARRAITGNISNVDTASGTFTLTVTTTPTTSVAIAVQPKLVGTTTVSGFGLTSPSQLTDGMIAQVTGDLNRSQQLMFATVIRVRSVPPGTVTTTPGLTPTVPTTTPTPPTTTTPTAGASVSIIDDSFNPVSTTVLSGQTVVWTNNDTDAHTVTADDGSFDSGIIPPGGTFNYTFTNPGMVNYHCSIHPDMLGSIDVQ